MQELEAAFTKHIQNRASSAAQGIPPHNATEVMAEATDKTVKNIAVQQANIQNALAQLRYSYQNISPKLSIAIFCLPAAATLWLPSSRPQLTPTPTTLERSLPSGTSTPGEAGASKEEPEAEVEAAAEAAEEALEAVVASQASEGSVFNPLATSLPLQLNPLLLVPTPSRPRLRLPSRPTPGSAISLMIRGGALLPRPEVLV